MITSFLACLILFAATVTAQDYVEKPIVVDSELALMTAVLFFFFAVVVVGTYTTHHWEEENRGKMIGIIFRLGPLAVSRGAGRPIGEEGIPFIIAKICWWALYALWALAMYFIWITKDQQSWVWYWSWSLFGVALIFDKIWPYLYFYTSSQNQIAGVGFAVVSIAANLIASLIIWFGQYWFFGGINLLVGNILLDIFIGVYFLFVINLGFSAMDTGRTNASARVKPQGYPAQPVYNQYSWPQ